MEDHPMSDDFPPASSWKDRWLTSSLDTPSQDRVVWTGSQTRCEALNSLLKEAAARPLQRPLSPLFTPLSTPSTIELPISVSSSSTSSSSTSFRRPLGRSRSFASAASSDLPEEVQAIEKMIANAAHQVTENAKIKKRHLEKQASRWEDKGSSTSSSRRKCVSRTLSEELADRTNVEPHRGHSRTTKRTASCSSGSSESQKPWKFPDRIPHSEANTVSVRSVSEDAEPGTTMQRGTSSLTMSMADAEIVVSLNQTSCSSPSTTDTLTSEPLAGSSPPHSHHQPQQVVNTFSIPSSRSTSSIIAKPNVVPEMRAPTSQHATLLRASQPLPRSTPPPLGMRRAHTTGSSTGLVPKALPVKRAGFKTPFARNSAGHDVASQSNRQQSAARTATSTARAGPSSRVVYPVRSPSPSHEADSSFGDMPFDLADIDEEMSKYE